MSEFVCKMCNEFILGGDSLYSVRHTQESSRATNTVIYLCKMCFEEAAGEPFVGWLSPKKTLKERMEDVALNNKNGTEFIAVLAGTYQEYLDWLKNVDWPKNVNFKSNKLYVYIDNESDINGRTFTDSIIVGTFPCRSDAFELEKEVSLNIKRKPLRASSSIDIDKLLYGTWKGNK